MIYSKAMIDLISEARKRVPSEMKPSIKLANPEVLDELVTYYPKSKDPVLKALIKEAVYLLRQSQSEKPKTSSTRSVDKASLSRVAEVVSQLGSDKNTAKGKPKRIYRGQVISD